MNTQKNLFEGDNTAAEVFNEIFQTRLQPEVVVNLIFSGHFNGHLYSVFNLS